MSFFSTPEASQVLFRPLGDKEGDRGGIRVWAFGISTLLVKYSASASGQVGTFMPALPRWGWIYCKTIESIILKENKKFSASLNWGFLSKRSFGFTKEVLGLQKNFRLIKEVLGLQKKFGDNKFWAYKSNFALTKEVLGLQ